MQDRIERYLHKQVQAGHIAAEDISVYRYGYTLLSEVAINLLIAVIIGLVTHGMGIVAGFLLLFIPLRSFCGGYHAKTFRKCMILSNVVVLAVVYVVKNYAGKLTPFGYVVAEVLFVAGILWLAPVQSRNKRLGEKEIGLYRRVIRLILLAEALAFAVAFYLGCWEMAMLAALVHGIQGVTLIVGKGGMI